MKISARLQRLITEALAHSLPVQIMVRITKIVDPDYDLYERTGFPANMPIPNISAARQITIDIIAQGLLIDFIEAMIDVHENGIMGKTYHIRLLPQIIKEIEALGYSYNHDEGTFFEKSDGLKTMNWGILLPGKMYDLTFMSIDIVNNTQLVRKYNKEIIAEVYADLKEFFTREVEKRNGRIWNWEGDGGLAAFNYDDKNVKAVLSGIDILLDLFLYNLFKCPLKEPLQVRIAVHTGPCQFSFNIREIQSETLRTVSELVTKYGLPDHLTISPSVYSDLGSKLELFFKPITLKSSNFVYQYHVEWED
ncbi:MAG: hypothetical protein EHM28_09075 [Spirochaetaceae bacterium]|nr:MAG: hypothetical protein EHM28_09075 [Spirochaetaceae bacterium]